MPLPAKASVPGNGTPTHVVIGMITAMILLGIVWFVGVALVFYAMEYGLRYNENLPVPGTKLLGKWFFAVLQPIAFVLPAIVILIVTRRRFPSFAKGFYWTGVTILVVMIVSMVSGALKPGRASPFLTVPLLF